MFSQEWETVYWPCQQNNDCNTSNTSKLATIHTYTFCLTDPAIWAHPHFPPVPSMYIFYHQSLVLALSPFPALCHTHTDTSNLPLVMELFFPNPLKPAGGNQVPYWHPLYSTCYHSKACTAAVQPPVHPATVQPYHLNQRVQVLCQTGIQYSLNPGSLRCHFEVEKPYGCGCLMGMSGRNYSYPQGTEEGTVKPYPLWGQGMMGIVVHCHSLWKTSSHTVFTAAWLHDKATCHIGDREIKRGVKGEGERQVERGALKCFHFNH